MNTSSTISLWVRSCCVVALVSLVVIMPAFLSSCKEDNGPTNTPGGANTATVHGIVYGKRGSADRQALAGSLVSIRSGFFNRDTLTTTQGTFSFIVEFPDTATTASALTISYSKSPDFPMESQQLIVKPGSDIAADYTLASQDTTTPLRPSKTAAMVAFIGASNTTATVKGSLGIQTVTYTFEVRDSAGVPIDSLHRALVYFAIKPPVGGGEYLSPDTAYTTATPDHRGRVTTTLHTGTVSGVVQVEASLRSPVEAKVNSPTLPIVSGPPSMEHFSIAVERCNFPALTANGLTNKISVQVGDQYSNPVPLGTPVYFSATTGIIQSVAMTDADGKASAILTSGDPRPADGWAHVFAQTVGANGVVIRDSIQLLITGQTFVIPADTTLSIANGDQVQVDYRVFDKELGHPLAQGTRVTVTLTGEAAPELVMSGNTDVTLPDTRDMNYTNFSVLIRDTVNLIPDPDKTFTLNINAAGPNGTLQRSYKGLLHGTTTGTGPATKVGSIILANISDNQISVQGTGAKQTATITFLAQDRSGRPVPRDSSVVIYFRVSPTDLGASIFPASGSTDAQGRVQAVLSSGTKAGVIQVQAYTDTGGGQVASGPVPITIASGLPSAAHFTVAVSKLNIPGRIFAGLKDDITVYVGDIYGNPVQSGTAVYFGANGGLVSPSGYTSVLGVATVVLQSGNPEPPGGKATITASTIDMDGQTVQKSVGVVFSGRPVISVDSASLTIPDGGVRSLHYMIADDLRNPLSSGTTITASLIGDKIGHVIMTGDLSTSLGDYYDGGRGVTDFYVAIRDTFLYNLSNENIALRISTSGPNGAIYTDIPVTLEKTLNPPISLVKKVAVTAVDQHRLTVRSTGDLDSTIVKFQIQDGSGNALPLPGVQVSFTFSGSQGSFNPPMGVTDNGGNTQTVFYTGSDTGNAAIVGIVGEISSTPQNITILPGKASDRYFTVIAVRPPDSTQKFNFPGVNAAGQKIGQVVITVKDRYGNPVNPGTGVQISTNVGSIQDAGFTDINGVIKADWFGGIPALATGAKITAVVTGERGTQFTAIAPVTYSGSPVVSAFTPALASTFIFPHGVDTAFSFSVLDNNGNPLAQGESLRVSVSGAAAGTAVVMSGDTTARMRDTRDPANAVFTFHLKDTNKTVTIDQKLSIIIVIDGPNGRTSTEINGTLKGAPPAPFKLLTNTIDNNSINVAGVGLLETSTITFQIQDSSHNPVLKRGVDIQFMLNAIGGSLTSQHGLTDDSGRVQVSYTSGVFAETVIVKGQSSGIMSPPQQILVAPGPPSQANFTLSVAGNNGSSRGNFPGMFAERNPIGTAKVRVRDVYSNIVKVGTPIHFTSNAGSIQAFAYTDKDGVAQAQWMGGLEFPTGGNAYVKAQALDNKGVQIARDSLSVLYSGQARIFGGLPAKRLFHARIDTTITYSVKDDSSNPVSQGCTISVTLSGAASLSVVMSGDVNVVTPDTRDPKATLFSVHLRDTNSTDMDARPLGMQITVSGPNGNVSTADTATLAGAPMRSVAGLALVDISASTLTVKGSDGLEQSLLTYEVRDSLDRPLHRDSIHVTFTLSFTRPVVGGTITPLAVATDTNGRIQAMFHSDISAGIASVIARIETQVPAIEAPHANITIVGGKPDQRFFTFILHRPDAAGLKLNYPGAMPIVQKIGVADVQAGDKYGNPVPAGTSIYFTTNAGLIQGNAVTDANGFAQVDWFGGRPIPSGDSALVVASAVGVNNALVADTVHATYSGPAVVNAADFVANYEFKTGIDTTITYTVSDADGNPLAEGSQVQVSVTGSGASSIVLTGAINFTVPDARRLPPPYTVRLQDTNTTITSTRSVSLVYTVTGPNGGTTKQFTAPLKGVKAASITYPRIAGLAFIEMSQPNLTVKNTGGIESGLLTFELRDSLDRPVLEPGLAVYFSPSVALGGRFGQDTVLTDNAGRAQNMFYSGTLAGIAQVQAKVPKFNITSGITQITIVGGKPDQNHFTFILTRPGAQGMKVNYPGALSTIQKIGLAQVQMGDAYGNPVPSGTPVYFSTNAGVIQGIAYADGNGYAQVDWFGGLPIHGGVANVTAMAIGVGSDTVKQMVTVVYSGQAKIVMTDLANGFAVPGGGAKTYHYSITDSLGLPLAAGNTFHVSASGAGAPAVILTGDLNVVTGDNPASASTNYSFIVRDTSTYSLQVRDLTFTIDAFGPNGIASQSAVGTLQSTGRGRSRLPGSIALLSTSANEIQVMGTGGVETSTMIFELRDSIGVPVDSAYTVSFRLSDTTNGAFISPRTGLCDPTTGRINAVLHAGIIPGPLQAVAKVFSGRDTITSTPVRVLVHAGQPDYRHFSISANPVNVAGYNIDGNISKISVIVGDKWGNPVPPNTAVWFTTEEGVITTSTGFTNENGAASATLFSANPRTPNGFGEVTAKTIGDSGVVVQRSDTILFSGRPMIDSLVVSPSTTTDFVVNFRVYDQNHNPLAGGTLVNFALDGDVSVKATQIYPDTKIPDTHDRFWTKFSFSITMDRHAFPLKLGPFTVSISVNGPNGTATTSFPALAADGVVLAGLTDNSKIRMLNMAPPRIRVNKGGDIDSTTLIYQLADSLERPIQVSGAKVAFSHTAPWGSFNPETVVTDANGRARTVFRSGMGPGPDHMLATVVGTIIPRHDTVLVVLAGRPNVDRMTVVSTYDWQNIVQYYDIPRNNYPGEISAALPMGGIRVQCGDRYGNAVPESTLITFQTDAGVIGGNLWGNSWIGGSGTTFLDGGSVLVTWYGGQPYPPNGIATISVSTMGDAGTITKTIHPTFSGMPITTLSMPAALRAGIDTIIQYHIRDHNGNPVSSGNTITVTTGGAAVSRIALSGDVLATTIDTQDPTLTTFNLHIKDVSTDVTTDTTFTLSIKIRGPAPVAPGTVYETTFVFTGILRSPRPSQPPASEGRVAGLKLVGPTVTSLTVKDGGGAQTSLLTYQVLDSLGNSLLKSNVPVAFHVLGLAGTVSPDKAITDNNGRVQTLLKTGSAAGVLRVQAVDTVDNVSSTEDQFIVVGGKPSQRYFTMEVTDPAGVNRLVNYPGGMPVVTQIGLIRLRVGDRYGNPVPTGTYIYFNTNAGVVQGSDQTDETGYASVPWYGGRPLPDGGLAKVYASTVGDSGTVNDSVTVTYSGPPVIACGLDSGFVFRHGIDTTITDTVRDSYGNPLAAGTIVKFTATGTGAGSLLLTGDVIAVMPDTRDQAATIFRIHIHDTSLTASSTRPVGFTISVSGPNGATERQMNGMLQGTLTTVSGTATPARLNLISMSASQLSVKDGGGTEISLLTYELEDSLGSPVAKESVKVFFSLAGEAGSFTPESTITDAYGRAQTAFHSGIHSGVVQIIATLFPSGISSTQGRLTIVGGRPSQSHFTFIVARSATSGTKVNYPGAMPTVQTIGQAQVQVGDKYGNPVPLGTTIYFGTTAGLIQGTAATDVNGFAFVNWFSGNPIPSDEVAILTASAIGDSGPFTDSTSVLYSGQAEIRPGVTLSNFQIPGLGAKAFDYRVSDMLGMPLAEGSTITVTASGTGASTLVLTGDVNVQVPDLNANDSLKTKYAFTARDTSSTALNSRQVTFTINVSGPNGAVAQNYSGTVLPAGVVNSNRSRLPASISIAQVTAPDIQVMGTGGTEISTINFIVRDSVGSPVDSAYEVTFSLNAKAPSGSYVSPMIGKCDTTGAISAILHSGTVAGVIQLVATITLNSGTIQSTPVRVTVHSGLPDQTHFTIFPEYLNFPGLDIANQQDHISVIVGDKYSNPVSQYTAVYFNTHAGVVTPSTLTDTVGQGGATLFSANPFPDEANPDPTLGPVNGRGFAQVFGRTSGLNGVEILDSTLVLFSGRPIITPKRPMLDTFTIKFGTSRFYDSITVADRYGNPISHGSKIELVAKSSLGVTVSDPFIMQDVQSKGYGSTRFSFTMSTTESQSSAGASAVDVFVVVTWWNGEVTKLLIGSGLIVP